MVREYNANSTPNEEGTIRGLAQAPLHFHNMVAELIDNAISVKDKDFDIYVDISEEETGGDNYILRVWDKALGISLEDLQNKVFTLGYPPESDSDLNEHGYGLKNVLAKVQQLTKNMWNLQTRNAKSVEEGIFFYCERPLSFSQRIIEKTEDEWPEFASKGTGTVLIIPLPLSYLQSVAVAPGRRGSLPKTISTIMEYLREHLGVFYRGYLEQGVKADGRIYTSIELGDKDPVIPIFPDYETKTKIGPNVINYQGKKITIEGEVGLVMKESPITKKRKYYYKHAPESQGVDFRIGRRVIATRLISEVWDKTRHPTLNGIAGEIRFPEGQEIKPPTLNNKTSLDFDSDIWEALIDVINQEVPPDKLPHGGGKSEADLRFELFTHIKGLAKVTHEVQENFDCGHGVFVDVYWNQAPSGNIDIYEVKKGKAKAIDVYQLMMYWDSLVSIGIQPSEGHLVSDGKTSGVDSFVQIINQRKDNNGNNYQLITENWKIHGIKVD